jgi:hypothetical protein
MLLVTWYQGTMRLNIVAEIAKDCRKRRSMKRKDARGIETGVGIEK